MTHLRQIMLEELQRRNYSESTIHAYIRTAEHDSRHFHPTPVSPTSVNKAANAANKAACDWNHVGVYSVRTNVRIILSRGEHGKSLDCITTVLSASPRNTRSGVAF